VLFVQTLNFGLIIWHVIMTQRGGSITATVLVGPFVVMIRVGNIDVVPATDISVRGRECCSGRV
jgi:hypothetical protein